MIELKSGIMRGETGHCRFSPSRHAFTYPVFFLALELSELPALHSRILGYNKRAILSIRDDDYLRGSSGSIRDRCAAVLERAGIGEPAHKTFLLTVPRCFGYVFNPVNFYISIDRSCSLHSLIAEVSNTFGEAHTYVLPASTGTREGIGAVFRFPKEFYVSPFLETCGMYRLALAFPESGVRIDVDLEQDGERRFTASLAGSAIPLSDPNLLRTLICYPFTCAGTVLRIQWQALRIVLIRRARIFLKPRPSHPRTQTYRKSWVYSGREWALRKFKTALYGASE